MHENVIRGVLVLAREETTGGLILEAPSSMVIRCPCHVMEGQPDKVFAVDRPATLQCCFG